MDHNIQTLLEAWQRRNIQGAYCPDSAEAVKILLEAIPVSATIGFSGSGTLEQLGIIRLLEARGNTVFNQYRPGISRPESLELRRLGSLADCYLTSANALSLTGELVFLSAYGHRIAGIASAKKVIVVCGKNKLTANLEQALRRAREIAAPLNCKRLNWKAACFSDAVCRNAICQAPDYKRMCCQLLLIEGEMEPGRLQVLCVGEDLGF